jgi:RNA polymerase sigma factor (sigma-70 family)
MGHRDRFGGRFEEILAAAQREEPWALEAIYRALGPVVTGYLRSQGAVEPEDLTSEVFVGVLRNLSSFEGDEAAFRSWVFMIVHRRLMDEHRRLRRRPPPEPLDRAADVAGPDDVEDSVTRVLGADQVRALCWRLRPEQRDVLLLRLVGGLSISEVAAALGKTPGAVKAHQRRGFLRLARLLQLRDDRKGAPL